MKKGQIEDLVGCKFGRLTVIEYVGQNKHRRSCWRCVCDCGNETVVDKCGLITGNTTSCGCYNKEVLSLPDGLALRNRLIHIYQSNAKRKGISFLVSPEEFYELTQCNCFYCGQPPSQIFRSKGVEGEIVYNGVDRIDSRIGYISGNIVPCCKTCNYAKSTMQVSEFKEWLFRASSYMLNKELFI